MAEEPQGEPCVGCGREECDTDDEEDQIFCDGCNACFCLGCASLSAVPDGDWFGECCTVAPAPIDREPTFEIARRPRLDKKRLRLEEVGFADNNEPATAEEVAKFKQAFIKKKTRLGQEKVMKRLTDHARQLRLDPCSTEALDHYVAWRVKCGRASSTILKEISALRQLGQVQMHSDLEMRRLIQSVRRLADCPSESVDPITLSEMRLLRDQTIGPRWRNDGSETSHRQLRNWTFFLLAFVGMFRSKELLELRWDDIVLTWHLGGESLDLAFDARPPPRAQLVHATLYVLQSKMDVDAKGEPVRIRADVDYGLRFCPVHLLLELRTLARPGQEHVFAETRRNYAPKGLGYDCFLNAFKDNLRDAGVPPSRLQRLALHSFRRGGATAAAAAGASIRQIKAHGRWRSDVAYIYALVSDAETTTLTGTLVQQLQDMALDGDVEVMDFVD